MSKCGICNHPWDHHVGPEGRQCPPDSASEEQSPSDAGNCASIPGYWERVRLLFRLRKFLGLPHFRRPPLPEVGEVFDAFLSVFLILAVPIWWPIVWLITPLSPLWIAARKSDGINIKRAVEKWERDLSRNADVDAQIPAPTKPESITD